MKVIIFDASGGIGKFAVQHALEKGHEVILCITPIERIWGVLEQRWNGDILILTKQY